MSTDPNAGLTAPLLQFTGFETKLASTSRLSCLAGPIVNFALLATFQRRQAGTSGESRRVARLRCKWSGRQCNATPFSDAARRSNWGPARNVQMGGGGSVKASSTHASVQGQSGFDWVGVGPSLLQGIARVGTALIDDKRGNGNLCANIADPAGS